MILRKTNRHIQIKQAQNQHNYILHTKNMILCPMKFPKINLKVGIQRLFLQSPILHKLLPLYLSFHNSHCIPPFKKIQFISFCCPKILSSKMVMAQKESDYEEQRRRRLEENKKRMEELHLTKLSMALKSSATKTSVKPSPVSLFLSFFFFYFVKIWSF